MSTCKGKRDGEKGNTHTRETRETSGIARLGLSFVRRERVEATAKKKGKVDRDSLRLGG
jgi:hypothetical protein